MCDSLGIRGDEIVIFIREIDEPGPKWSKYAFYKP